MGLFSTAWRHLAGRAASERDDADTGSGYDPDLECFLLQMNVLSQARMVQRARELCAVGFERRQQGYEATEREFDYVLRCNSVAPRMRERWLAAMMYALRCEVERQDLSQMMKRSAAMPPPLPMGFAGPAVQRA